MSLDISSEQTSTGPLSQGDHPPGKPGKVRELKVVREKSGKLEKVRESYNHHLAGARVAKIF